MPHRSVRSCGAAGSAPAPRPPHTPFLEATMRAERPAAARSFGEREAARSGRLEPLSLQAWACRGLRSPSVRVEQLTVSHRRAVPYRSANFSVKGGSRPPTFVPLRREPRRTRAGAWPREVLVRKVVPHGGCEVLSWISVPGYSGRGVRVGRTEFPSPRNRAALCAAGRSVGVRMAWKRLKRLKQSFKYERAEPIRPSAWGR